MNYWQVTLAILALSLSPAVAEDFKTVSGKEYKNATVSRVEPDGIVLRTKTGISKVYFAELPEDVQDRFRHGSSNPSATAVTQTNNNVASANQAAASFDAVGSALQNANQRFVQQVEKRLDERESILQGKHTPGPAELAVLREINWHKIFLVATAIIAAVLFAIVWRRFT